MNWDIIKSYIRDSLHQVLRNATPRRVLWGLVFFIVFTLVLGVNFTGNRIPPLQEGQISPQDISSPKFMVIVDNAETERLRTEAAMKVNKVYRNDQNAATGMEADISHLFSLVTTVRADQSLNDSAKVNRLRENLAAELVREPRVMDTLSNSVLSALLRTDPDTLKQVELKTVMLVDQQVRNGITEEALDNVRDQIENKIFALPYHQHAVIFMDAVFQNVIRPNIIYDIEATRQKMEEARNKIPPVRRAFQPGQTIVHKGDPVGADSLETLRQLGLQRGETTWTSVVGLALFILIVLFAIQVYLYLYKPSIFHHESHMVLLGLLLSLTLLLAKGVTAIEISKSPEISALVGYMIPLGTGSMLITILLDNKLAMFSTFLLSLMVPLITGGNQLSFAITAFVGGLAGVYTVSKLSQRSDLVKAGIYIALANMFTILANALMTNTASSGVVFWGMLMGIISGILSSVLTIGFLPYLESTFGITSTVKLLELSDPNHPLLKKLLVGAPGTYHHSIVVGNLAETAAEAVGADPLLVRVGAYYHDIGKTKRPYFFIENQVMPESPHEKIAPSLSTLIITSHVKDGLEMARDSHLPPVIQDIVAQHHGTSLVAYFYHKALESERGDCILEIDYRYEGPKPQTKEAALVMLADNVEAAVRAMQKPTPGRVEGIIRKIIKDKLQDGQLDECDLTFQDLDRVAIAFGRVLGGIFHTRIEYPEAMITEIERRRAKRGAAVSGQ